MENKRDRKIDILRFIALIGIFIAHVQGPTLLMQLRSFDVPLMAMLMGTSFYLSNRNREFNYGEYVKKRIKRLILPTWQFLSIFFVLIYFASVILNVPYFFDFKTIISSYLLLGGIGYVWIIGVFLAVALLNPFILKFSKKIEKNSSFFLILLFAYVGYLGLTLLQIFMNERTAFLYENLVLYTIAYGFIAAIGIRLKKMTTKEILIGSVISLIVYLILAFVNDFSLTSVAKYPPTTYYLSYAIGIIFMLDWLVGMPLIYKAFDNRLVYFISENSLWIYFWHIIPVYALGIVSDLIPILNDSFVLRLTFVVIVTLVLTMMQNVLMVALKQYKQKETAA